MKYQNARKHTNFEKGDCQPLYSGQHTTPIGKLQGKGIALLLALIGIAVYLINFVASLVG